MNPIKSCRTIQFWSPSLYENLGPLPLKCTTHFGELDAQKSIICWGTWTGFPEKFSTYLKSCSTESTSMIPRPAAEQRRSTGEIGFGSTSKEILVAIRILRPACPQGFWMKTYRDVRSIRPLRPLGCRRWPSKNWTSLSKELTLGLRRNGYGKKCLWTIFHFIEKIPCINRSMSNVPRRR